MFLKLFLKKGYCHIDGNIHRKKYTEYQGEFVEHFPYGKQIGNILDIKNKQKRHRAPKPIFLGLESEKSENQSTFFERFENL